MSDVFQFKQFAVSQANCAMKVNTDGVLLGALAGDVEDPENILDIGTGTGVIALMLAQRFTDAEIDAVEVDAGAAKTAEYNFSESPFSGRLTAYQQRFQDFFDNRQHVLYDLIVSNPPFYTNALVSPNSAKAQAKHADMNFFGELMTRCAQHLVDDGRLWLIVPSAINGIIKELAAKVELYPRQIIQLRSYVHSEPHREIIGFGFNQTETGVQRLIIYDEPKIYSKEYQATLKNFLTIFK